MSMQKGQWHRVNGKLVRRRHRKTKEPKETQAVELVRLFEAATAKVVVEDIDTNGSDGHYFQLPDGSVLEVVVDMINGISLRTDPQLSQFIEITTRRHAGSCTCERCEEGGHS
jgi:hypothetical protein